MEIEKVQAPGPDQQEPVETEPTLEKRFGQAFGAPPSNEPFYLHGWRLHLTTLGYVHIPVNSASITGALLSGKYAQCCPLSIYGQS